MNRKPTARELGLVVLGAGLWTGASMIVGGYLHVNPIAIMVAGWATIGAVLFYRFQRPREDQQGGEGR